MCISEINTLKSTEPVTQDASEAVVDSLVDLSLLKFQRHVVVMIMYTSYENQ